MRDYFLTSKKLGREKAARKARKEEVFFRPERGQIYFSTLKLGAESGLEYGK